jgi:hypothetical protein
VTGFPGAIHVPFLSQVFSGNTTSNITTEIVMLLTPHIIRSQEINETDLKPIYIGSQQNLGIGGPPPLIAPPPAAEPAQPAPAPGAPTSPAAVPLPGPLQPGPGGTVLGTPPGSTPVPGTVLIPAPAAPAPANPAQPDTIPPAAPVAAEPSAAPAAPATSPTVPVPTLASAGIGSAQVLISPPSPTFRVGGGPYTVPISVTDAARLSTVTLTVIFDPTKLRVRTVQEGSFMRAGGVSVVFNQQVNGNRVDITLTRSADATGASGTGLLSAILFDAIAPGSVTLTVSGAATGPGGTPMGLRFTPATIAVQ